MGFLYSKIDAFLNNTDLSISRRLDFIDFIISPENDIALTSASIKVFDEIEKITKYNPQEIIDLSRTAIYKNQNLTKLASFFFKQRTSEQKEKVGLSKKIEIISVFWEVSHLLKFPAYLLSQRKAKIEFLNDQKQILNHFKFLGISKSEIDLIRKIRNAHYHPFTFRGGILINDKDDKVADFETIETIFVKVEAIIDWWFKTLTFSIYYNPVFSTYLFYAIRDELGQKKELYKESLINFQEYLPFSDKVEKTEKERNNEIEDKPPLLAVWITKGWKFIKNPIGYIKVLIFTESIKRSFQKSIKPDNSRDDLVILANRVREKVNEFGNQLILLSSNLNNSNDALQMKKIGKSISIKSSIPMTLGDDLGKELFELVRMKFKEKEEELEDIYKN